MPFEQPPSSTLIRFAERVRSLRTERDLTQEQLAKKAGLSKRFIIRVEHDSRNISLLKADMIANALGVKLKDLLD